MGLTYDPWPRGDCDACGSKNVLRGFPDDCPVCKKKYQVLNCIGGYPRKTKAHCGCCGWEGEMRFPGSCKGCGRKLEIRFFDGTCIKDYPRENIVNGKVVLVKTAIFGRIRY